MNVPTLCAIIFRHCNHTHFMWGLCCVIHRTWSLKGPNKYSIEFRKMNNYWCCILYSVAVGISDCHDNNTSTDACLSVTLLDWLFVHIVAILIWLNFVECGSVGVCLRVPLQDRVVLNSVSWGKAFICKTEPEPFLPWIEWSNSSRAPFGGPP